MSDVPFRDRTHAGRRLAGRLAHLAVDDPVVIALPRGGVPVAREVAESLGAPLDVLVVRKLGAPGQPELAVGAIAEGGAQVRDTDLIRRLGVLQREVDAVVDRERQELTRRIRRYRGGVEPIDVSGRTVVLVDDGLATGSTARAAVAVLRQRGAARIVVAVPVAPPSAVAAMLDLADVVVCVEVPARFRGVGEFYADFSQVTDAEVVSILADAAGAAARRRSVIRRGVVVDSDGRHLPGELAVPDDATGVVVVAHGSGSGRLSPRNTVMAAAMNQAGLATLLFDMLTPAEAARRGRGPEVALLGRRVEGAVRWLRGRPEVAGLDIGCLGASTGAAAVLVAAADAPDLVRAVVCRGGRTDLARDRLAEVTAPVLLVVGSDDAAVEAVNRQAAALLGGEARVAVVEGASHLFEEPGALLRASELARDWFTAHLGAEVRATG